MRSRERRVRGDVTFGCGEDLCGFREPFLEHCDHRMQLGAGGVCVGLGVNGAHGRRDHVFVGMVDGGQDVAGEVDLAALPGGAGEHSGDRRFQSAVRVGDHQAHTVEATVAQRAQERRPEHFVFGVTDVNAEHFTVAVHGDRSRNHDGASTMRWLLRALM